MENADSDEISLEEKNWKVYCLSASFIASSLIQWLLLINFEVFEFLLNYWLLFGAYVTFMLIVIVHIAADFAESIIPVGLRWIFGVLTIEIFNIALGITVVHVSHLVFYCSLAAVLIFLILLFAIGRTIKLDHLKEIVLAVFVANMLLIILASILMLFAKFLPQFFFLALFTIGTLCYIILIINTLYISMLIEHHRYAINYLTSCIKPAVYIHAIFGLFVWFTLLLAIEINKIAHPEIKQSFS